MVFRAKESARTRLKLRQMATWQLVLVLIVWLVVVATLLRLNNIQMIQRRDAVIEADKSGDSQLLVKNLTDLQTFASQHMNASTGKFYLEHQYERDKQKAAKEAEERAKNNQHGNVYKKAAQVCDPHYTLYSDPYFRCILNELDKYSPSSQTGQTELKLPDPAIYSKEFVSPRISFDWAGLSVLVAVALAGVIVIRLFSYLVLSLIVKIKEKYN